MKLFLQYATKIALFLENLPLTLATWTVSFASIVFLRYGIEQFLLGFPVRPFESAFLTLAHYFLEFLFVALLFMLIIRFVARVSMRQAASFTIFGFLLILTPPVTDFFLLQNPGVFSLYEFGTLPELVRNFFTFFDATPDVGITYGIRIEIALASLIIGAYAFFKRRSLFWGLAGAFLAYLMLFIVCTLPSWLAFLFLGPTQGLFSVTATDAVRIFMAPAPLFGETAALVSAAHLKMALIYGVLDIALLAFLIFRFFPEIAWPLLRNARFPQLIYHGGLLFLGGLLALTFTESAFRWDAFHILALLLLLAAVECAWLASVVVNDLNDQKIDLLTNPKRPLIEETMVPALFRTYGWLFFAASLFLATLVYPRAILFLLGYQAIAWLYSSPPLRLKCFPFIASLLAATASLLVLLLGYVTVAQGHTLSGLPWQLPFFLWLAYALVIPLKDLKDIEGDKNDGVYTIPVLLGETWSKHLLSSIIFILFIASVFVLGLTSLFPLALLFGALGFWLIEKSVPHSRWFNYRALLGWIVGLITSYGFLLFLAFL